MTTCDTTHRSSIHPALAGRFSPVAFDPQISISPEQVDALLDAARLAPSAGNSQPWRFIVGVRGDAISERLMPHLSTSSLPWASEASLLVVNLTQVLVEETADMRYSEFAHYDLGQAVAHMTIQALEMGFGAHQFRAFNRDAVTAEFEVPAHREVTSITAFGVAAHERDAPTRPGTSRERLSRDAVTWDRA